jgi:hypothetical protein
MIYVNKEAWRKTMVHFVNQCTVWNIEFRFLENQIKKMSALSNPISLISDCLIQSISWVFTSDYVVILALSVKYFGFFQLFHPEHHWTHFDFGNAQQAVGRPKDLNSIFPDELEMKDTNKTYVVWFISG